MKRSYLHALIAAALMGTIPFLMGCRNACPHEGKSDNQQPAKPQENKILLTDTVESDSADYEYAAAPQDTNEEEPVASPPTAETPQKKLSYYKNLDKLLRQCEWHDDGWGAMIPSFFKTHYFRMVEEAPGVVDVWEFGDIKICTWYGLGFWAAVEGDYPVGKDHQVYLSDSQFASSVTYQSKEENHYFPDGFPNYSYQIFSGYTRDGMVYYLKRHSYTWNRDFGPHVNVIVLIYPKTLQRQVKPLINRVRNWRYSPKKSNP